MIRTLPIHEFLEASKGQVIIDVRTPAEFAIGHLPDAHNLPLFTNEERALVGTCYKQQGREKAILLGFELIGTRWAEYIRQADKWCATKEIYVHCWRGGMRSASMAWALSLYGYEVCLLSGGYKSYRAHIHDVFKPCYPFIILSGKTGCAKTETLIEMKRLGEQVIDLEELAQHQGSAFGSMGRMTQPTQETFENLLGEALKSMDLNKRIWLENESVYIGKRGIPNFLFEQMRFTHIIDLELPLEERLNFLEQSYGTLDPEFLKESVLRIAKRLGPNETKLTLQAIDEGRMRDFIRLVLIYYDKTYQKGRESRPEEKIHSLALDRLNPQDNAKAVIEYANHLFAENIEAFMLPSESDTTDTLQLTSNERH